MIQDSGTTERTNYRERDDLWHLKIPEVDATFYEKMEKGLEQQSSDNGLGISPDIKKLFRNFIFP